MDEVRIIEVKQSVFEDNNKDADLLREQLKAENLELKDTYAAGYDLEEIKEIVTAIGMVPKDEIPREEIHVVIPQPQREPSRWENFWSFVTGLFA